MTISLRIRWMASAACCAMSGCSVTPPGTSPAGALSDGRDACVERSVARQEHTEMVLGSDAPVTRRDDPLAPANIAANAAQNELLNCLRTSAD
jgi:hypothetical protein